VLYCDGIKMPRGSRFELCYGYGGQKRPNAEAKDGRKANSHWKTKKDLMLNSKMMRSGPDGRRKATAQRRLFWTKW
jgi:hypothetical protein